MGTSSVEGAKGYERSEGKKKEFAFPFENDRSGGGEGEKGGVNMGEGRESPLLMLSRLGGGNLRWRSDAEDKKKRGGNREINCKVHI